MNPYRIVLTGPESSGKTTLAQQLSNHLEAPLVPEFARTYLSALQKPYELADLAYLQRGQQAWEQFYQAQANNWLILDTDWTVYRIWLNHFSPGSNLLLPSRPWSLSFLCSPDIPWECDPLREHPTKRNDLFEEYKVLLEGTGWPFKVLSGNPEERLEQALQAIQQAFGR